MREGMTHPEIVKKWKHARYLSTQKCCFKHGWDSQMVGLHSNL